jgi:hypothetical protein
MPRSSSKCSGCGSTRAPPADPGAPRAPRRVAPPELRYAQVQKHWKHGRVVEVTRSVIFGEPTQVQAEAAALRRASGRRGQINTAYIERDSLTLRQELRRLARMRTLPSAGPLISCNANSIEVLGAGAYHRVERADEVFAEDTHDRCCQVHGAQPRGTAAFGAHGWTVPLHSDSTGHIPF